MKISPASVTVALLVLAKTFQSVLSIEYKSIRLLSRDEIVANDKDVIEFYQNRYDQLDSKNVSYDDQLFWALKAYRQSNVFQQFDYRYTDKNVMAAAQGPKVDRKLCRQQLEALVKMAKLAKESPESYGLTNGSIRISAINFLGTSGRTEAGVLDGNKFWPGSYSGCLRAKIPADSYRAFSAAPDTRGDIVGRYCVGHLKARSWPKWDKYYEDRISIRVGVCLPDSCHSLGYFEDDTTRANVDYLVRSRLDEPFNGDRYFIDHFYCLPDEDSHLRQWSLGAKVFVAFCSIWVTFLAYCSIRYGQRVRKMRQLLIKTRPHSQGQPVAVAIPNGHEKPPARSAGFDYIKAFSVVANLEHLCKADISGVKWANETSANRYGNGPKQQQTSIPLCATKTSSISVNNNNHHHHHQVNNVAGKPDEAGERRVNLDVIDGIRVLCTIYIVAGHTFLMTTDNIVGTKQVGDKMFDFTITFFVNSTQPTHIFFILTGCLVTYLVFTRQKVEQLYRPLFWAVMLVGRYLRLVPLYFLMFWFAKQVASYTGAGAYWYDYRTDASDARSHCGDESWWTMLTLSTGSNGARHCLPHAWYLTVDFRLMFIIPFYIVLLARNQIAGYLAILVTFILATIRYGNKLEEANVDWSTVLSLTPNINTLAVERMADCFLDVPIRLRTCLLGVLTGHLLYLYKTRQIKEWPRWFRLLGLKLTFLQGVALYTFIPTLGKPFVRQYLPSSSQISPDLVRLTIPMLESGTQISVCICILLMTTGGGFRTINKLFSSRLFKVLASISYAVFIVHIELIYKFPGFRTEHIYWFMSFGSIFFNVVAIFVGFFVHLLYEMPINNTTRHLLKLAMGAGASK